MTVNGVPVGWREIRIGELAYERRVRSGNGVTTEVYSVTKHGGFIRSLDFFGKQVFSRNTDNYKLVQKGDLAYATIHLDEGSIGILESTGSALISPMYTVFQPLGEVVEAKYLYLVLKQPAMLARYRRIAEGSVHRRKAVSFDRLAGMSIFLPSLDEQRGILAMLDSIDDAIERTEEVIAATENLRRALLRDLLTNGMPGWHTEWKVVPGLGRIPADWEVVRLGEVAKVQTGRAVKKANDTLSGVRLPYLSVVNVKDGYLDLSSVKTMSVPMHEVGRYSLKPGDVLFTEGGDADKLGRGCVWRGEIDTCLHQNHVFAVRPNEGLLPEYLSMFASSFRGKRYFLKVAKQTTNLASVNSTQLKEMLIPLPLVTEQRQIQELSETLVTAEMEKNGELAGLKNLKASLSNALLTGRVRVPVGGDAPDG